MTEKEIIKTITDLKDVFIKEVTDIVREQEKANGRLSNYEIVWKELQDLAAERIKAILEKKFKHASIIVQSSKSTYPDVKLEIDGKFYAIDIKCNEDQKEPWFDVGRIDTFENSRLNKYVEEWELVIRYNSENGKFIKAYFLLLRHIVGIRVDCGGIKYRPYDGKIRPKSWKDFDENIIYWESKSDFLRGLKASQIHRWKNEITKNLIPVLSKKEVDEFKKLFDIK